MAAPPPAEAELREMRASALTAKVVAVLLIVYMLGVVGFFIYDHLL